MSHNYKKANPKKIIFLTGLALFFCLFTSLAFALSNPGVQTGDVSPNSGSFTPDQAITFTTTFSDARGLKDIQYVGFMVNTNFILARKCFYGQYDPAKNRLYILDDSGRGLLGGFAPGSNRIIENSYCRLDCSKSSVTTSGNTLSINWAVSFKPPFIGNKNLYLYIKGKKGGSSGWDRKGTISIVFDNIPPTGSISINNNSGYTNSASVTLTLSAQDNEGGSGISQMQFSNDNVNWSVPEVYATSRSWDLAAGDGTKTVYVKFKDAAGNWSQAYSDIIILDTAAPELNITYPFDNAVIKP